MQNTGGGRDFMSRWGGHPGGAPSPRGPSPIPPNSFFDGAPRGNSGGGYAAAAASGPTARPAPFTATSPPPSAATLTSSPTASSRHPSAQTPPTGELELSPPMTIKKFHHVHRYSSVCGRCFMRFGSRLAMSKIVEQKLTASGAVGH